MIYAIIFFVILFADQLSKLFVDALDVHAEIIPKFLAIDNTRNPGAAFSFLADKPWSQALFIAATVGVLIALGVYLVFTKSESRFQRLSLTFVAAGAVGNLIDRLALSGVRDFIHPYFFANFNVADVFVVIGAIMLAIYFLFVEEDAIFAKKR